MPKCVYCKKVYHAPKGLTLVMKDGTINYLCSPKCKKNMAMKRRKVRWILKSKKEKAVKVEEPKVEKPKEKPVKEEVKKEEQKKEEKVEKVEEKKE